MYTVFSAPHDEAAVWAAEGLRRRGLAPLELVGTDALAFARGWEHRVGSDGAHFRVMLPDGRRLCSSRIRAVLNRIPSPSLDLISFAAPSDRLYAMSELPAFYLSWLHSLKGVVINRPRPFGLSGAWRHSSEWAIQAARAGFNVPRYRQSSRDAADRGYFPLTPEGVQPATVIVLHDRTFGAEMPDAVRAACIRLARNEGVELLGVDLFQNARGEWLFGHANPSPYLQTGGEPLLDYMTELFQSKKGDAR